MTHLPSLSQNGLWDVFLCEPLNYNHSRRKTKPCPSSSPQIAARFICDATFTEEERVRADLPYVCPLPGPQGPPGASGREMEHCFGSRAAGALQEELHLLNTGPLSTSPWSALEVTSPNCARLEVIQPDHSCAWYRLSA